MAGSAGGKLTFTSGANAGRAMEIKRHAGTGTIELWQAMSEAVVPGDAFAVGRRLRQAVRNLQEPSSPTP